jgi:predicted Ser/Thr protein kinase
MIGNHFFEVDEGISEVLQTGFRILQMKYIRGDSLDALANGDELIKLIDRKTFVSSC